jgi:RNA polymerase sigma-70 factor (ECF subfamily)
MLAPALAPVTSGGFGASNRHGEPLVRDHDASDPSMLPGSVPAAAEEPDDSLIRRVCAGETACFELLMRRHNERIYRTVRAVLGDDTDVEDVMQQAYVSAYQHLDRFENRARFSTWMTRIAINEAYARLRKRHRTEAAPWEDSAMADEPEAAGPSPEQIAANQEIHALLERAVDTLSVPNRMVFVLRSVQGLSTAETADCLKISEEAVKTRLHRANEALRLWLEGQVGDAVPQAFRFHRPRCDAVVSGVLARIVH